MFEYTIDYLIRYCILNVYVNVRMENHSHVGFKEYNLVAIALPYIYLKKRFLHYTIQQREPYIFISSPSLPHKKLVGVKVWFIIKLKLISEFVL